ncbi:hypothetical protein [Candidatus Harpocratesius sp.]
MLKYDNHKKKMKNYKRESSTQAQVQYNMKILIESTQYYQKNKKFQYELFQIPFLNLTCDISAFQEFWKSCYYYILNTNANSIEIILNKDGSPARAYLLECTNEGLLLNINSIDIALFTNQFKEKLTLKEKFDEIFPIIKKNYNLNIGNIHIYSNNFIEELFSIFSHTTSQQLDFIEVIVKYSLLFIQARNRNNKEKIFFECFPETDFTRFIDGINETFDFILEDSKSQLENTLISFIKNCIPRKKFSLSIQSSTKVIAYLVDSRNPSILIKYLPLNPSLLDKHIKNNKSKLEYLKFLKKKYHTPINFIFDLAPILKNIEMFIQSPFPVSLYRLDIIFQSLIKNYRSYGFEWLMHPSPLIMNEQFRYWQYAFKIPLNIRKLAYWNIPRFVIANVFENIGVEGKILAIFGDNFHILNHSNNFSVQENYFGLLWSIKTNKIQSVSFISADSIKELSQKSHQIYSKKNMKKKQNTEHCKTIKQFSQQLQLNLYPKFGYIHTIYWISTDLIRTFMQTLRFDIFSSNLMYWLKLKRMLKKFKDLDNFYVYPNTLLYNLLLHEKSGSFLKEILPILVELREF